MKSINEMPGQSRIWIYPTERPITAEETQFISESAAVFVNEWTSHGKSMDASIELLHGHFLVIAADEAKAIASGCGIDKTVHFVQSIGKHLTIDFFKRTLVHFINGEEMQCDPLHVFWAKRKAGVVSGTTLLFDNSIRTATELSSKWLVPFEQTWHQEMWAR